MENLECIAKKAYNSRKAAMRVLRCMGRYNLGSKEHHVYKCDFCRRFHIGQRDPRIKKKRGDR